MSEPTYSIIIPVYNRPDEVYELLDSLVAQTVRDFEVLIIEDGSSIPCESVVDGFKSRLTIHYYFKENTGQGFSRNYGSEHAKGEWLLFFDSDCVIPSRYLASVHEFISANTIDSYSGPDMAAPDFSRLQRAISYSMTSFLTTGGIRGKRVSLDRPQLRGFNMGIKKEVFTQLGGFARTNMGEDMELSNRVMKSGHTSVLIPNAGVYHKRRNTLWSFAKQIFSFGRTRVQLYRTYTISIRVVHVLPLIFLVGLLAGVIGLEYTKNAGRIILRVYLMYFLAIGLGSSGKNESALVGLLSMITSLVQHCAYGAGFLYEAAISLRDKLSHFLAKRKALSGH